MKYLISDDCCRINRMAAAAKGHDMIGTRTIFNCRGGCLEVDANNEKWIPEEYKALLVDELPDEFKEAE